MVDGCGDRFGCAEDAPMPDVAGVEELRVRPRAGERVGVSEWNLAVVAIVDDEQGVVASGGEAIEGERIDADAGLRGETMLEADAIGFVEADEAREATDRVVDEDVRRDHHVARRARAAL